MKASFPIGVDILEWKKARSFYRAHRERLDQWLTQEERSFVKKRSKPYEAFAMLFAAKEAVFKAVGARGFGPDALRRIRLEPQTQGRFKVVDHARLEVAIRRHRRHVVACCYTLKVS